MKDLANDMDSPIKRLQCWWNPFQRIKREYRIRRMFAQEIVSGHWFITTESEGKDQKGIVFGTKALCEYLPISR